MFASVGALAACASPNRAPAEVAAPAAGPANEPAGAEAVIDERPGYRARVDIGEPGSPSPASWTDIVVLDTSDRGRRACELRAEREVSVGSYTALSVRVGRPCATEPLPAPERHGAAYLLVTRRADTSPALLVFDLSEESESDLDIEITDHARMSSKAACERMLGLLAKERERGRREDQADTRRWLEQELRREQEDTDQACEAHRQAVEECAPLVTDADLERACRRSHESRECEQARKLAFEQGPCLVEQNRTERACEAGNARLELVRGRLAQPDLAEPPAPLDDSVCRRFD